MPTESPVVVQQRRYHYHDVIDGGDVCRSWVTDAPKDRFEYDGPSDVHQRHSFNEKNSNMIPSARDVPDVRDALFTDDSCSTCRLMMCSCRSISYDLSKLPTASVILVFHNEVWRHNTSK